MEYPNYYFDGYNNAPQPEQKPPKRGIGGYIITAIIFTIVGALLATIFMPAVLASYKTSAEEAEDTTVQATPTPSVKGNLPQLPSTTPAPEASATEEPASSSTVPELTPIPPAGTLPEFDGVAPEISDSSSPLSDVIENVSEGVVGIVNYAYSEKYSRELEAGSGSGFVISSEGYILTNAHVVEGATKLGVMFVDGEEVEADLVGYDKTFDIAVLKVDKTGLKALKLGDSEAVRVGEFVITIGDPTGRELSGTTTYGIISATARSVNIDGVTNDYLQTDAAVNPGNSGGPLINMSGEVIGIVTAKTTTASYDEYGNAISAEGLGFAIPINQALKVAEQLIVDGSVARPGIGISVATWNEMYAEVYGTPEGILVASVIKDGPGHKAGLLPNDIIIEIDGHSGMTQDEFVSLIRGKLVGDSVEIKYWRSGEYYTTTLVLADLNSLGEETYGGEADYNFFGE